MKIQIEAHECMICHRRFESEQECLDHEQDCKRRIEAAFQSLAGRRFALSRQGTTWLLGEGEEWDGATAVIKLSKAKQRAVIVEVET